MKTPVTVQRHALLAAILFVLAIPVFAQTVPAAIPTPVKWIVNGYVQGRYSKMLGLNMPGSFDAKRAYINLRVDASDQVSAGMMASGMPGTSVLEAYGEYRFTPEIKARLGLYRVPFGVETPSSSSKLITLERSQVTTAMLYRDFTFDRGLYAYYTPAEQPYDVALAVTNGNTTMVVPETNNVKNIVGRIGRKFGAKNQVGASVYSGKGPTGQTMLRYGLDLQLAVDSFLVQSEILAGKGTVIQDPNNTVLSPAGTYVPTKARGAYVTVAYQAPGSKYQPYLRVDGFDPDTGVSGDYFNRTTVGCNYYVSSNGKFTVEYQDIHDNLLPGLDAFIGTQYQVTF